MPKIAKLTNSEIKTYLKICMIKLETIIIIKDVDIEIKADLKNVNFMLNGILYSQDD